MYLDEKMPDFQGIWNVILVLVGVITYGNCQTSRKAFQFNITEEQPNGTFVGDVSSVGTSCTYSLYSPTEIPFLIDPQSGIIETKEKLDREYKSSYTFDILCDRQVIAAVSVSVKDINDNTPQFSGNFKENCPETAPIGYTVLTASYLIATDPDEGIFSTQKYSLVSGDNGSFSLTSSSSSPGINLVLKKKLDRESVPFYSLIISASDGGNPARTGYTQVNISVGDANDCNPVFTKSLYVANVSENAKVSTSILTVVATDDDEGSNGLVKFKILADSDPQSLFSIGEKTGVIRNNFKLDYEQIKPQHTLRIQAMDSGLQPRQSIAYVQINILDENDNAPTISLHFVNQRLYQVREDAKVNSTIALALVKDKDSGDSGLVKLELQSIDNDYDGDFKLVFSQNPGYYIKVAKPLDREKKDKYAMKLIATDFGVPPLTTEKKFVIKVGDINDSAPKFKQVVYNASISEFAPLNSNVITVTAVDKDSGTNAQLMYMIINSTESYYKWFKIDPSTGQIRTNAELDRETVANPQIVVKVVDVGNENFYDNCTVRVYIIDENDNSPVFSQASYNGSISENSPPGESVVWVSATDLDEGINGKISYSILSENGLPSPGLFQINSSNGLVTTEGLIDHETRQKHTLIIVAADGAGRNSTATVEVKVLDLNDNSPVFTVASYSKNIYENAPLNSSIIQVHAEDKDSGKFKQITYFIVDGNGDGIFHIDPQTGVIELVKPVDREKQAYHRMTIKARDGGGLLSKNNASVYIGVLDINDEPPIFTQDVYHFQINENKPAYTVIGIVLATSKDLGDNAIVSYKIKNDPGNIFSVDSNGTVFLLGTLDHEVTPFCMLILEAKDGGIPTLYGYANVSITVNDLNDNKPTFPSVVLNVHLPEDTNVGDIFYTVSANDKDSGENGKVFYTLLSNPESLFTLDMISGNMSVNQRVPFQEGKTYDVTVFAEDQGRPKYNTTVTLRISVKDVNDHKPVFNRSSYVVSVSESENVNKEVLQITATDSDYGDNAKITFSIQEGKDSNYIGITSSGEVFVKQPLDRETQDVLHLIIVASDEGVPQQNSSVSLTVHVLDENDNNPKFEQSSYTFSVTENEPNNTYVGTVKATDKDAGKNAELIFSLDLQDSNFFMYPNGEIRTRTPLDREVKAEYKLEALVKDNGTSPRIDKANINILIEDENDNRPAFESRKYEANIDENAANGSSVIRVTAKDADTGANGWVTYSLAVGEKTFQIDSYSGLISTLVPLDRESKDRYVLSVVAKDNGVPPLDMVQMVVVNIRDVNDNYPKFVNYTANVDVPERLPVGSLVTTVKAEDLDGGENGQVRYEIKSGNTGSTFKIDSINGEIRTELPLDFERTSSYKLEIKAKDSSLINPKSSVLPVYIHVLDSNDNQPTFDENPIIIGIVEGTNTNQTVITISAHDEDSGVNSRIVYSIKSQSPKASFTIDPLEGHVRTVQEIDREEVAEYTLIIKATDQALNVSEQLSSTATLKIIVTDINDCAPEFTSRDFTYIMEDEPVDYPLMLITAEDRDSGDNAKLKYEITAGNDGGKFLLDSKSGLLKLATLLDHETVSRYVLNITAKDHGSPQLQSTQQFTIDVIDVNDMAPTFDKKFYNASVYENEKANTFVVNVHAKDEDTGSNALLTYSIPSGIADDKFAINSSTGKITTVEPLDREQKNTYTITVYASDGAFPFRSDTTSVVVHVLDMNDIRPSFQPPNITLVVPENQPATVIHTMVAQDADIGGNGKLHYKIISGNNDQTFSLGDLSGELSTTGTLDREVIPNGEYHLVIEAKDSTPPYYAGYANMTVKVADQNDNSPQFSAKSYNKTVPESTSIGTVILKVSVDDKDIGKNAEIVFSLSNDVAGVFQIDPFSGEISTVQSLDYETTSKYRFLIRASDQAEIGPRSETAAVTINVADSNDHAPQFTKVPYERKITETLGLGHQVITVSATDEDTGKNSKITYSFKSASDYFSIDTDTGIITVSKDLNGITKKFHVLHLRATDGGAPPLVGNGIVEITIGNVSEQAIKFLNTSFSVSIPENSPKGNTVAQVLAKGQSNPVVYSIASGNHGNAFKINAQSGIITVETPGKLDYEILHQFELRIMASIAVPLQSGYLTIYVNLTDQNDNKPEFSPSDMTVFLIEDNGLAPGSVTSRNVTQVVAIDHDSGSNALVTYQICSGNNGSVFKINKSTGMITTQKPIDRELKSVYSLVICAEDHGSPKLSASGDVHVNIGDLNDNEPIFPHYDVVRIFENTNIGTIVKVVKAKDADANSAIRYYLKDGSNSKFSIDQFSGTVVLSSNLDYELEQNITLVIVANDSVHAKEMSLQIEIADVNDHTPVFTKKSYKVVLPEDTPKGESILKVEATDDDSGTNAEITYSFGFPASGFAINSSTGIVYTTQKIQFDPQMPVIQIVVLARDGGSPQSTAFAAVQIEVSDVNDNAPRFPRKEFSTPVYEDKPVGSSVITVTAIDKDASLNNTKIDYSIKNDSLQHFRIGLRDGIIRVNFPLDYEKQKLYTFSVKATDHGNPVQSATTRVTLRILDVNDNKPVFNAEKYYRKVSEDIKNGSVLLTVHADDYDSGPNGVVRYEISSGNDKGWFHIDPVTGVLTTVKSLDHDTMPSHLLSIIAKDKGSPQTSEVVSVIINVSDVNDNAPEFRVIDLKKCVVKENSPLDTPVVAVTAIDKDSGKNKQVVYSIVGGDGLHMFKINRDSGMISTNASLDFESKPFYVLIVNAVDQGQPPLSSNQTVHIAIVSEDEFDPKFDRKKYEFTIPGNAEVGSEVGQVKATDEDSGEGGTIVYTIVSVSINAFRIDKISGIVYLNSSLIQGSERRKRSLNLQEAEKRTNSLTNSIQHRKKRSTSSSATFVVEASTGKERSRTDFTTVNIKIDYSCEGCTGTTGSKGGSDSELTGNPLIFVIVFGVIVGLLFMVFLIVGVVFLVRKHKRRQRAENAMRFDGSFDPIVVQPPPIYSSQANHNHVESSSETLTTKMCTDGKTSSMMSSKGKGEKIGTPDGSTSSGRGSSEGDIDDIDDRRVVIIDPDGSVYSEVNVKTTIPDSGIQQDDDQLSELTVSDGSGILSHHNDPINDAKNDARLYTRTDSHESIQDFEEEGGGEAGGGMDVANILYARLSEVDADEDEAFHDDVTRGFFDEGNVSYGGSLSSIVGSQEELTGSYNWDYLLDWGPQFQPLSDVFMEISRMKDDSPKRDTPSNPETIREGMSGGTSMLSSVSSLPRTPMTQESSYSSPALSPNFTPAITPLITRSPSVSPLDTCPTSPVYSPPGGSSVAVSHQNINAVVLRDRSIHRSNSDLTHSPSISDVESNLEVDV